MPLIQLTVPEGALLRWEGAPDTAFVALAKEQSVDA
jgi:hypothetical protein